MPPPPPNPSLPPTAPVILCPLQGPAKAAKRCRLMKTDGTVPQCVSAPTVRCALGLQSPAGPEPLQSDARTPGKRQSDARLQGTAPVRRKNTRNQSSQTHVYPEPLQSDARAPGTAPVRRTYTRNRSSQTHEYREPLQSDARVPGTAPVRRTCTGTPSFRSKVDALSIS